MSAIKEVLGYSDDERLENAFFVASAPGLLLEARSEYETILARIKELEKERDSAQAESLDMHIDRDRYFFQVRSLLKDNEAMRKVIMATIEYKYELNNSPHVLDAVHEYELSR